VNNLLNLNNIANANFGAQLNTNTLPSVNAAFQTAFTGALNTPVPTLVNVGAGFQVTGFQTVRAFSETCAIPGACDSVVQPLATATTTHYITPVISFNDNAGIVYLIICLSVFTGLFSGASALLLYRESKHVNACPVQRRSLSQKV